MIKNAVVIIMVFTFFSVVMTPNLSYAMGSSTISNEALITIIVVTISVAIGFIYYDKKKREVPKNENESNASTKTTKKPLFHRED